MKKRIWIQPVDKLELLKSMMTTFKDIGKVSFEGDLSDLSILKMNGVETAETACLKRATVSSKLDFVVVPLSEKNLKMINQEFSERSDLFDDEIIHVQIESNGVLVFAAYDNFDEQCTFSLETVSIETLDLLKSKEVINGYKIVSAK